MVLTCYHYASSVDANWRFGITVGRPSGGCVFPDMNSTTYVLPCCSILSLRGTELASHPSFYRAYAPSSISDSRWWRVLWCAGCWRGAWRVHKEVGRRERGLDWVQGNQALRDLVIMRTRPAHAPWAQALELDAWRELC